MELTHFNEAGKAKMVHVGEKADTERLAVATGKVNMAAETLQKIREGRMGKGDVLAVAQVAGIMAAKKTWELIPMCHPLQLSGIDLLFYLDEEEQAVEIAATVQNYGKTGVEMEALTAVSVAALTIYDMCKAVDKEMEISQICLVEKRGGRSGTYQRPQRGE
ncbi:MULTISPECIES: cyclic pyranopterin monophosphate synthase MoaC [Sporomusaceae]|uniref:cyclic pyranopterin monophosphate synthase MoaC n=1 Tax=Sporomusaceae TaxID=1843490 RepID=UPI000362679D|nr:MULTISPECIES: cyclic pyranopterin monophosphate synthase MoaC [Sporomusaceae]